MIHQTVDCNAVTRLLYCIIYQLLFSAESLCLLLLFFIGERGNNDELFFL